MSYADLRREYQQFTLDENTVATAPVFQFELWFDDAVRAKVAEPNAMTLATADSHGNPNARIVLLKGVAEQSFIFFTDYRSAKGRELDVNPRAALVFHWQELERQVRIRGTVARLDATASDEYFQSRPLGSRIGAIVSNQSAVIASRDQLETEWQALLNQDQERALTRPDYWGGCRLVPDEMEFWQGRPSRLHDRILYTRKSESAWYRARLSP
jgi:pyridoxamine 5'-phosphate oxidase